MNQSRRTFLRAALVSPVIASVCMVYETEAGRINVRPRPIARCAVNGPPNQSCRHTEQPGPAIREALDGCLLTDDELHGGPIVWSMIQDPLPEWPTPVAATAGQEVTGGES
jgi:hypothetical protein